MSRIFLIAITQIGIALIGTGLRLEYPTVDWGLGLFTGFFIGSIPVVYILISSYSTKESNGKENR